METTIIPIQLGFVKSFLVVGSRAILVDAGMPGSLESILKALKENCVRYDKVSLILVTHAHGDHVGGLWDLKDMLGAPVAVHRSEAQCLADGSGAEAVLHNPAMKLLSPLLKGKKPRGVAADVLVDDSLDLAEFGVEGTVIHTPGHSNGSLSLITADGSAIVGDMVGGRRKPALPGVYLDLPQMRRSIASLGQTCAKTVYTSHGGVHRMEDVLKLGQP